MKERLNELRLDAGIAQLKDDPRLVVIDREGNVIDPLIGLEKFAELIVRECIKECNQEWYDFNAESVADDDPFKDPRATGIRVGQKAGVLKCISKIKQHFGVEE
jgi:hypothetical protein